MEAQSGIDLAGKVAVVTGASRGIGAAIAGAFAEAGGTLSSNGIDHRTSPGNSLEA